MTLKSDERIRASYYDEGESLNLVSPNPDKSTAESPDKPPVKSPTESPSIWVIRDTDDNCIDSIWSSFRAAQNRLAALNSLELMMTCYKIIEWKVDALAD